MSEYDSVRVEEIHGEQQCVSEPLRERARQIVTEGGGVRTV